MNWENLEVAIPSSRPTFPTPNFESMDESGEERIWPNLSFTVEDMMGNLNKKDGHILSLT